jgi:hypothetical protein
MIPGSRAGLFRNSPAQRTPSTRLRKVPAFLEVLQARVSRLRGLLSDSATRLSVLFHPNFLAEREIPHNPLTLQGSFVWRERCIKCDVQGVTVPIRIEETTSRSSLPDRKDLRDGIRCLVLLIAVVAVLVALYSLRTYPAPLDRFNPDLPVIAANTAAGTGRTL